MGVQLLCFCQELATANKASDGANVEAVERFCCMARFAEAQMFKSRACVRKTLESFIPPGQNMIFLKTIPFQQGLACRFEVDATVTVFDSFVQVASGQQCRVQIRKEEDVAADSRVFWP